MYRYIVTDLLKICNELPWKFVVMGVIALFLSKWMDHNRTKKEREKISFFLLVALVLYVMIMFYITFTSRLDGDLRTQRIDLKLFSTWGRNNRNHAFVIENILLFIPYGFLLPTVFKMARNIKIIFVLGCLSSLVIEIVQNVTRTGVFQIDDIITNTLGTCIGYLLFGMVFYLGELFNKSSQVER